jgi:hypothetical protein
MLCLCYRSQLRRPIRSCLVEQCAYSHEVWSLISRIGRTLLHGVIELREENFFHWWLRPGEEINPQAKIARRAGFDSFFFLVAWRI